ncbi:type IV pilus biogenesis protein PilM [Desmospora activa]|uniref:Tfp pilus assembly PilM family ATPase n=1 Tax=Desmospora activa DSM 45169 TaxID=1121389 RepID=A0A2T4ZDU6_9BACL|nr:pilus assembly protein PilM [Desmospora activa]PTM60036.1 Tfp pilus assembly PilM family ATPase [Desmospora activa DSM 45169]
MLGFRRYAIGVELTDSVFKLVELKKGFRRLQLSQYVIHPLLPIWMGERSIIDPDELIQSIQDVLSTQRLHTRQVRVALGHRHVVTGRWHLPEMGAGRMRRWIEKKVLPEWDLPFDDPVFDFQVIGHVWQDGDRQEVVVAVSSRRYVEELAEVLRWCGLELVAVDLSALSLNRWFEYSFAEAIRKWGMLHLTHSGVDVSLFNQGVLQGATFIPLELKLFLEGVPDRPSIDPLQPLLKDESQRQKYGKALLKAMRPDQLGWIGGELWKPDREWVLSGEGIDIHQLSSWLQSQDGIPPIHVAEGPQALMTGDLQLHSSNHLGNALSAPLGAALTGVGIT